MSPGFARAFGRATVLGYQRGTTVPLAGVAVTANVPGGATPWPDPLYADESDTTPVTFPVQTDASGAVALWADAPARVELSCAAAGYFPQQVVLDLEPPPADGGGTPPPEYITEDELAAALGPYATDADLAAHAAAGNPHPTYATDADLAAHAAAGDPHPVYVTVPEGDARWAAAGAAGVSSVNGETGAVVLDAADVGALTQTAADARYSPTAHSHTGVWVAPAGTSPKITVQSSAPGSPATGDLWVW